LSAQNYIVNPATSGKAALRFLESKQELPDIILLDIDMPGMNGYQLCRRLKASERTCDIPVIFVSVGDQIIDKAKAFAQGGVDYITKPFQEEEVLLRLQVHLLTRDKQKHLEQRAQQRAVEAADFKAKLDQEVVLRQQAQRHMEDMEQVGKSNAVEAIRDPDLVLDRLTANTSDPSTAQNVEGFSDREIQILKLLASGIGNRDLAERVFLSEATVKWHLRNIYLKLGVNNRSKAIIEARKLLLI